MEEAAADRGADGGVKMSDDGIGIHGMKDDREEAAHLVQQN